MITDTGYVSDRMKGMIQGSDAFMFESNHDVDMLRIAGICNHRKFLIVIMENVKLWINRIMRDIKRFYIHFP
jgi:hypothetical protein